LLLASAMAVVCKGHVSAAVTEAGDVFAWGPGDWGGGILGLGTTVHQPEPARVGGLGSHVLMLAVGFCHQAAVADDGAIYTWGYGGCGRLGHGDLGGRRTPTRLGKEWFAGSPVLMVSCGGNHTVALTAAGCVWTCGANTAGELGHGDTTDRLSFTLVSPEHFGFTRVLMVACGDYHNAGVTAEGMVWTWGAGWGGRLGHNDEQHRLVPTLLEPEHFDDSKIVMVAAGCSYTVAVAEDGSPWVWGWNWFGQLGLGDCEQRWAPTLLGKEVTFGGSRVHMAACGSSHTLFVTQEGRLWVCGNGGKGQLGLNDRNDRRVPTLVEKQSFGGARIIAVDGGENHTVALTEEGALYTWGQGGRTRAEYYEDTGEIFEGHYDDEADYSGNEQDSDDEAAAAAADSDDHGETPPILPPFPLASTDDDGDDYFERLDALFELAAFELNARSSFYYAQNQPGAAAGAPPARAPPTPLPPPLPLSPPPLPPPTHTAALTEEGGLYTWAQGAGEIDEEVSDDEADAAAPIVPPGGPPVVPGGLGHADLLDRLVPTPISSQMLGGSRVGRCHSLPAEHALAFAMGTHAPLVGGSRAAGCAGKRRSRQLQGKTAKDDEENLGYWFLMMPGELVKRIVEASGTWPEGEGGRPGEGVARLMGAHPLARAQEQQVTIALAGGVLTCPAPARRWNRRSSCSCSCSIQ